jgi:group I intron endonuclease
MKRGIYKITNPKGEIYIGLSKDIEKRWKQYKNRVGDSNKQLQESLRYFKYDTHFFEIKELIEYSILLTEEENDKILREKERYWIDFYNSNKNGLNGNRGGCGVGSHTSESKQKISSALKGKPKPDDFGEKRSKEFYTDEWKQKISQSNKGRISPNKGKIGYNKGKIMTDDQKQKISLSLLGKKKPNAGGNKPIQQYTTSGQFIAEYKSVSEAHRLTNVSQAGISLCCNNKRMSSGGFKWKFFN